jgi:ATP-dependent DNA helicase RecQ
MEHKVNDDIFEHRENGGACDVLRSVFGYEKFRGEQEAIIDHVIAGKSCCVLMPTGSGKSICYQIPALCRKGVGVVVSPLIALMEDQVASLRQLGVRAAAIHSGAEGGRTAEAFRDLRAGTLDLVYVSPERLMMEDFLDVLDEIPLALFAIDEAHCISQWGHDFRPEYQQLSLLCTRYAQIPRIAVTATADEPTRKEIMERLDLPMLYTAGFDRPNIHYEVAVKDNPNRQLLAFLSGRASDESGIIYCLSRRRTEEVAQFLEKEGYRALPYHAGLESSTRSRNQESFLKEEGIIMVATIAFGMGINKPDVRFVVHLDLPKNIESYYQETGRAGRDGLPAVAWMIYGMQDVALRRQMIESGESPEAQKRLEMQKLNALLSYCETAICRRRVLLCYFGDTGEDCGNCDTCLRPPKTFDGTVAAQKVLSCIYRTNQMFGAAYIIDVLLGTEDERIRKFGHDQISTFGIGAENSRKEWQGIIRQLLSHGLIYADMNAHGGLKMTAQGAQFLKDKTSLQLRLDEKAPARAMKGASRKLVVPMLENETDQELFGRLKALRLSIAREQNIPPYVVFHDRTLIEIALKKPENIDEFSHISGVGKAKMEKYGELFLGVMKSI